MMEQKDLRNYFIFDGVPSTDFQLYTNGKGTYDAPAADIEHVTVPGKSGDLLRFNNRYENAEINYESWIADDLNVNLRALRSFLLSRTSYCRLEDTYHPDEYRMACYTGGLTANVSFWNTLGQFTLTFTAKPQRYLKSGEQKLTSTSSLDLYNPSYFPSKPLIRIYGNGTLTVGNGTITVSNNASTYVDIDCELMDAHTGSVNRNADIVTNTSGYITLGPGHGTVTKTSGISSFEITPRWYYL